MCLKRYHSSLSKQTLASAEWIMKNHWYNLLQEKDKLVGEVIRYVLFKSHQTSGCPIKREELTQIITKNYSQWSLPALVISEARVKISSIFGYQMKELLRSHHTTNRQGRMSQQSEMPFNLANLYSYHHLFPWNIFSCSSTWSCFLWCQYGLFK